MTARPSLQRNAYFNGIINNAQLQVELENIQNNILFIIPQTISFGVDKIVHTDLRKHILYSFGNEEGYYRILGSENDQVWIKGDVLVRQNRSNGKEERQCKIMFTESFHYGCHDQTREVWFIIEYGSRCIILGAASACAYAIIRWRTYTCECH